MELTSENKILKASTVTETIDLLQLDTEIAHYQDVIAQTQKVMNRKVELRESIIFAFPNLEAMVYPKKTE